MPVARVKYDAAEQMITVTGEGRLWLGEDGGLVGARDAVSRASLSSLRAAVRRADHYLALGPEVSLVLYDAPEDQLLADEAAFNPLPMEITVLAERCLISCTVVAELGTRFDRHELTEQLTGVLKRRRLVVLELNTHDEIAFTIAHLTCEVRGRGRTLGDAVEAGEELLALWAATLGGGLTASAALDLVRAQRPELLIGEPESIWLEVKGAPYRLQEPEQQLELAKDIAALANTQDGGLLVIGLATSKRDGIDTISRVRPIPVELIDPLRYRRVLDRLVYPPAEGLFLERVDVEPGKGLLAIVVPDQPAELRPLLVLGAIMDGRIIGSHVSIVRRRGDETVATHPAALHSLIAAGRAALAGHMPTASDTAE